MRLRFHGHAAVSLEPQGHLVLIDPFLSGNPLSDTDPDELEPSHILLTHAHADHVGDTERIAKRSGATVVSSFEIANHFAGKGVAAHGMNPGGSFAFPFGRVTFTPAWHSSSFDDGTYGGMPMGVVVEAGGKRIYHAGDTALFGDMRLIGRKGLDLAFLPIGDNFTMGPEDALEAVRLLEPKRVVPIHYGTFEAIEQDPESFKERVERETGAECVVLKPGEGLELD